MLVRNLVGLLCLLGLAACGGGSSGSHSSSFFSLSSTQLSSRTSSSVSVSSVASLSSNSSVSSGVPSSNGGSSVNPSSSANQSSAVAYAGQMAVVGDPGTEPVIVVANPTYSPIVDETLVLDWFAYSAQQNISSVTWAQISGPTVDIKVDGGLVKLRASATGSVVVEATATDSQGHIAKASIQYMVKAPLSSKTKLLSGRSDGVGVDLVIVGDGFKADEQQKLVDAANDFIKNFSSLDPKGIAPHVPLWNFWVVESVSASNVISSNSASPSNTLFKSYFNCNAIMRLLCVDTASVSNYVAINAPQYDLVLVVVNSTTYGGAGYDGLHMATFSLSGSAFEVAVHEMGHSFAGLGDEYDSNDGQAAPVTEPPNVDLTIQTDPHQVKWAHWIEDIHSIAGYDRIQSDPLEVGYFQGGAYVSEGVWRPTYTSMMRELAKPLGSVNSEAWAISVWKAAANIQQQRELASASSAYRVFYTPSVSGKNLESIHWTLNGATIDNSADKNFILAGAGSTTGTFAVSVKDGTGLIRKNPQMAGELTHTFGP